MSNNYLVLAALSGMGCLLANSTPAHAADMSFELASNETASSREVELRPAPVPLVRRVTKISRPPPSTGEPPPRPPTAAVEPMAGPDAAEPLSGNARAGGAAKAAVEADGYKRVMVLGRGPNGTWRVKGHRGNTEVLLTVDEAGSVTLE
jgi:hypothetical protein